jgi:hypothetical protein
VLTDFLLKAADDDLKHIFPSSPFPQPLAWKEKRKKKQDGARQGN